MRNKQQPGAVVIGCLDYASIDNLAGLINTVTYIGRFDLLLACSTLCSRYAVSKNQTQVAGDP
jgi:hypothetical protein